MPRSVAESVVLPSPLKNLLPTKKALMVSALNVNNAKKYKLESGELAISIMLIKQTEKAISETKRKFWNIVRLKDKLQKAVRGRPSIAP